MYLYEERSKSSNPTADFRFVSHFLLCMGINSKEIKTEN